MSAIPIQCDYCDDEAQHFSEDDSSGYFACSCELHRPLLDPRWFSEELVSFCWSSTEAARDEERAWKDLREALFVGSEEIKSEANRFGMLLSFEASYLDDSFAVLLSRDLERNML